MFDWAKVRDIAEVLVIFWGFISGGIVLYLKGTFVQRFRFEGEVKRLDEAISHCRSASTGEANALTLALSASTGASGRLEERLHGLSRTMDRIVTQIDRVERHLLDNKL